MSRSGQQYPLSPREVARWYARIQAICESRLQAERQRIYPPEPRSPVTINGHLSHRLARAMEGMWMKST